MSLDAVKYRRLLNAGIPEAAARILADSVEYASESLVSAAVGTAQTMSLLGPYRVNFDDIAAQGGNDAIALAPLDVGVIVVNQWIEVVTPYSGGGLTSAVMVIGIAPTADLTDSSDLGDPSNVRTGIGNTATYHLTTQPQVTAACRVIGDASLIAYMNALDATPTAGAVDVYALIATPAE